MKEFRIYRTDSCYWLIEVSGGFNFDDLTYDTMNELSDFLLNLGYEEVNEDVEGEWYER